MMTTTTTRRTALASLAIVAGLAFAAVATSARAPYADVQQIVRRTKSLYDATKTAEVRFEQSSTQGTTSGTLQFTNGNRYRLEFPKQTIVSNGSTIWTYTPSRNQVVISKAKTRSGGLTPSEVLTKFPGSYRPTLVGERTVDGRNVYVVRCDAGAEKIGDVTSATLYIDRSSFRFHRIELQSPTLGAITLKVTAAKYNIAIPDARFQFTPPAGARVINLAK
jgi:outer membrane lipoprotein carrier protein